tara:strand:+ start:2517 stop:3074 length:558 start_codon:yes stop_codon:yes gene_type:complete
MFTENEHEKYKNVCEDAFKVLEGSPGVLSEEIFDYAISVAKVISESRSVEEKIELSKHALLNIENVQGTLTEEERREFFNVLQTNVEDTSMKQVVTENWARRGMLVTSPLQLSEGDYLVRVDDTGNDSTVIVEGVYNSNPGLGFTYRFVTEDHTTGEQFFADEQQVRARGECVFYETVGQKRDKN